MYPLRVAIVKADMIGERAVDHFVIGIAHDPAFGRAELGVRGIRHYPVPTIAGKPTGAGNAALRLMRGVAARDMANGLERDACAVGHGEVLRRRHIVAPRRNRCVNILRAHDLETRLNGGVSGAQHRPTKCCLMAQRRDGAKIVMRIRQDGAVLGRAQVHRDSRRVFDLNNRLARDERLEAIWREILLRIVGVQLFDKDILVIDISRRQPPTEHIRAPRQNHRHAGDRAADDTARAQIKPCEIPD